MRAVPIAPRNLYLDGDPLISVGLFVAGDHKAEFEQQLIDQAEVVSED